MLGVRPLVALAGCIAVALSVLPAASYAASAQTVVGPNKLWVVFEAAPGELNQLLVEVSTDSRMVRLSDRGAAIAAGPGCQADATGRVVCRLEHR